MNSGEHVSTDGWVQPVAVLLIDGACRRLPEPERTERAREWIAEVVELSRAEYEKTARAALRRLGLTYEQLARQARTRQFTSEDARRVWLAIGNRWPLLT